MLLVGNRAAFVKSDLFVPTNTQSIESRGVRKRNDALCGVLAEVDHREKQLECPENQCLASSGLEDPGENYSCGYGQNRMVFAAASRSIRMPIEELALRLKTRLKPSARSRSPEKCGREKTESRP